MAREDSADFYGQLTSPGGFIFGVSGWMWGEPRPTTITFFLDNTAKVCDQHGRPIRGAIIDNKEVRFAPTPPTPEDPPGSRAIYATHAQVIAALATERVDWKNITWAGWPQLPYERLKEITSVPPTPVEELRKIRDPILRKAALRLRREVDEAHEKDMQLVDEE